MKQMKILVLGGTGAMGKPVVKKLGARGHRVDVTTRKARNDEGDNIHYVVGNAHGYGISGKHSE